MLFVFLAYLPVFLLKFPSRELIGCIIKLCTQQVPTRHTFDGSRYPQNKKYLKEHYDDIIITFFRYFLFLGLQYPSKLCQVDTCWMQNLIPHPTRSPDRNLSKNTGRYVENMNKKVVFSFLPPKLINIILLF